MARAYQLRRPAGVTFVLILTWIVAFLSLVRGFLGLLGWETTLTTSELEGSEGALFGAVELGLGIATAIIALGLARGSNLARFLVSAVMVLRIIAAVWVAMTFSGRGGVMASAIIGGMAVIILLLLWNSRADRFFLQG